MEVYPTCILCNQTLSEEEKNKNEELKNYSHPLCNNCLKSITKSITSTFSSNKKDKQ